MIWRTELDAERVQITFSIPGHMGASSAHVVGEFNGWSRTATAMTRTTEGFEARAVLAPGRIYRFRYLLDGERWHNDWEADDYADNDFGGSDSVVDLT